MPRSSRDEEFSAFVQTRRTRPVRSACLLTAGDTHLAEDLVQTAPVSLGWDSAELAQFASGLRCWSPRSKAGLSLPGR
ncbi:MAG: hypothetical protein ACRDOH_15975 [Streptosporangiaceae bacterium]